MDSFKKVTTIASAALPVDEKLMIRRCRYMNDVGETPRRVCLVTGTHGDELEGQYVCFALAQRLAQEPESLHGIVDIYPALNPLGIDSITRGVPSFDLDMNRMFSGSSDGSAYECIANEIVKDIVGSNLVLDIHASSIFLREILQARVLHEDADSLIPIAKQLNLDFVWAYPASTVLKSTLAYALNEKDTPCLVIEMDVGMRINTVLGDRLVEGILNAMAKLGMWSGEVKPISDPICAQNDGDLIILNAPSSGIFVPDTITDDRVKEGDRIGRILDPLNGVVLCEIFSPCDALVFTTRAYPVVYQGSLIARLYREGQA